MSKRQKTWMNKALRSAVAPRLTDPLPGSDPDIFIGPGSEWPKQPIELNQRSVNEATPRDHEYTIWDHAVPGFGLRVRQSGNRSYVLIYRPRGRRKQKRVTIGNPSVISLQDARKIAKRNLGEVYSGRDPGEQRRLQRTATLEIAFQAYQVQHLPRLAPEHARATQRIFRRVLLRSLGDKALV